MNIVKKKSSLSLALSAAALISTVGISTTAQAQSSDEVMGKCHGINSCKGQTACATAEGACAGTNSCAGKGWLKASEKECSEKKGKFETFSK